ncbi:LOW QUALITY PROTEIN: hypothetical protein V2J09_022597 [Rumex salicifolius]
MRKGGFLVLSPLEISSLSALFADLEIWNSLKNMGSLKAHGPDGFHATFFKSCWATVGPFLLVAVHEFFNTARIHEGVNDTILTLIGKVNKLECIQQFRSINLCNVLYKIITKIMVPLMNSLVGPTQSSFISDRSINDNVVLLQEVVHSMRSKCEGKKWMMQSYSFIYRGIVKIAIFLQLLFIQAFIV